MRWHIEMHLAILWAATSRTLRIAAASFGDSGYASRCAVGLAVVLALATNAQASDYRIRSGDTVTVYLNGQVSLDTPHIVDQNGSVPVEVAGYIPIAGLSAEQAQSAIHDELVGRDLFTTVDVLVVINEFGPIYVSGAVQRPGSYPFRGAMSVAQAVTVAGGPVTLISAGETSPIAIFQYYNAIASLDTERRTLLRSTLALQRIDAQIANKDTPEFSAPVLPGLSEDFIQATIAEERERFALQQLAMKEEETLLAENIRLLNQEMTTVVSRSEELQKLVVMLSEEVASAESLRERGLSRQSAVVTSQRNLSMARIDMLEMERALTITQQRIALEEKKLRELPTNRILELGDERARFADAAVAARARIDALGRQIALFPSLVESASSLEGMEPPGLRYEVDRLVSGERTRFAVDESFELLPGDLLIVGAASVGN